MRKGYGFPGRTRSTGDTISARRRARLLAVPIVAGLVLAGVLAFGGSGHGNQAAALQAALYSPGGSEPGETSPAKAEKFWQTRLTYPTGRFNQRWVYNAAKQAKRIKSGIPSGHYRGVRGSSTRSAGLHGAQSIKALAAA